MDTETKDSGFEKPDVPKDAKFERRGFKSVAEVEEEGRDSGEAEPANARAATEEAETRGAPGEGEADRMFDDITGELPASEGESTEESVAAGTEGETLEGEDEAPKGGYKVGGKLFRTQREAFDYAEELEQERIANDAFRQGVEAAQNTRGGNTENVVSSAPKTEEPEELPEEYWTNPAKYLKELKQKITAAATDNALATFDQRERHNRTWREFYSDYPDLIGDEELVQNFVNKNWETIKNMDTKKGLKVVADQTRSWIEERVKKRMPKTELKKVPPSTSSGTGRGVTPQKQDEKPLSMVQQMRKLKEKRTGVR